MKYFHPNTKAAIKIAIYIKGLCASIAAAAYYTQGTRAALLVMIVGFVANEAVNLFSAKKIDFSINSKNAIKLALFLKGLAGVFASAAYYVAGSKGAVIVMFVGMAANEAVNAFGPGTNESNQAKEPCIKEEIPNENK